MKKSRHPPYTRFKGFLTERGITYRDIADLLGISTTAVGAKVNGKSDFSLSEAQIIKRKYKPEREIFL